MTILKIALPTPVLGAEWGPTPQTAVSCRNGPSEATAHSVPFFVFCFDCSDTGNNFPDGSKDIKSAFDYCLYKFRSNVGCISGEIRSVLWDSLMYWTQGADIPT